MRRSTRIPWNFFFFFLARASVAAMTVNREGMVAAKDGLLHVTSLLHAAYSHYISLARANNAANGSRGLYRRLNPSNDHSPEQPGVRRCRRREDGGPDKSRWLLNRGPSGGASSEESPPQPPHMHAHTHAHTRASTGRDLRRTDSTVVSRRSVCCYPGLLPALAAAKARSAGSNVAVGAAYAAREHPAAGGRETVAFRLGLEPPSPATRKEEKQKKRHLSAAPRDGATGLPVRAARSDEAVAARTS